MRTKRDNIKVNILTRSSNRPKGFKQCHLSILRQSYKNIDHIVSYDSDSDIEYLKNLKVKKVKVTPQLIGNLPEKDEEGNIFSPHNLYCNELLQKVSEGWIMFLDDDDRLFHNKVIEELVEKIRKVDEDTLIIWQMRYPNGKVVPPNNAIYEQKIEINKIGSPCVLFHSKYKNKAKWDTYKRSDYRFIKQLADIIPKKLFIKKVYIQLNNFGDFGKRNDISARKVEKMPFLFKKNVLWKIFPKKHSSLLDLQIFNYRTYIGWFSTVKSRLKKYF